MRTVAMRTPIIFKSMLPPAEREISSAACARSGGPRLGNFEGAAIDRSDIENFAGLRSEEHTSELQSQSNLVCRLLLEKKKKNNSARPNSMRKCNNNHT